MLRYFFTGKPSVLDEPIGKILTEMNAYKSETEEFSQMVDQLSKLNKMKTEESRNRVSPDTWVTVCGSILGILIIVAYEHSHVMVSRGLGFVLKSK